MTDLYHFAAVAGAVVIAFILVSKRVKGLPLSAPLLAVAAGVVAGPEVLAVVHPSGLGEPIPLLIEAARLTVGINLMATALRLTRGDLRRLWAPAAVLLTAGMVMMAAISGGLAWAVAGAGVLVAAMLGASLAPTDPVLANTIVTGGLAKANLPRRVRSALTLESGINDGLAYPLVMLPLALMQGASSTGEAVGRWLVDDVLIAIGFGAAAGWALGWLAARALVAAQRRDLVGRYSLLAFAVALSVGVLYGVHAFGGDGLLAVFVAGLAFGFHLPDGEQEEMESLQEGIGKLFTLPVFVLFGTALPWAAWAREGGAMLAAFAVAVLLLRRLPRWLLLWPALRRWFAPRDGLFLGWFGPIGVAPLFYITDTHHKTQEPLLWAAGSMVILASVIAHAATSAAFTRAYGRRARAACDPEIHND